jgi:predicted acetyltransferase
MPKNDVDICSAEYGDKHILHNLMQLYLYEFSAYDQADVNQSGLYDYKHLDRYWAESNRHPFIIRVKGQLAGFVLISRYADPIYDEPRWSASEFFIMKKYRRKGIGTHVAVYIFDMFQGKWQVAQIENNLPAQSFWREVIGEYTHGVYKEIAVKNDRFQGTILYFDNALSEDS